MLKMTPKLNPNGRDEMFSLKGVFKGFAKQTLSVSVSIEYKDGRQFEEVNQVKLQKISEDVQKQLGFLKYQLQLQQQQQQ